MTGLLRLLRFHADAVEADLDRYYQRDYRDRWRFDDAGRRKLTLRMILVRIRHLPPDSAVSIALGGAGWTVTDYLVSDLFHAQVGKKHPGRPKDVASKAPSPDRERKLAGARRRRAQRQRAIEAGEIT